MVPVQREFLRVLPLPQSLQVGLLLRKKVDSGLFSRTSGLLKGRVVVTIPEMSRSRNLASGDGGGGKWQRISLNGGVVSSGMAVNYACGPANKPTNLPASLSNYSQFARIFVLRRLPHHQRTCFDQFLHNVAMFHPIMTICVCKCQASCQKEKLHDDGWTAVGLVAEL